MHWPATVWVEPDFITARAQGQSLLILLGLRPPICLTALIQLITFGSVTANHRASQSHK